MNKNMMNDLAAILASVTAVSLIAFMGIILNFIKGFTPAILLFS